MSLEIKNLEVVEEKKQPDLDEIGRLVLENNEMLKEILVISHKTKHFLVTQQIMTVLKILLIVVPLVLSAFYLTPLLKEAFKPYIEIMDAQEKATGVKSNTQDLLKNYLKQ